MSAVFRQPARSATAARIRPNSDHRWIAPRIASNNGLTRVILCMVLIGVGIDAFPAEEAPTKQRQSQPPASASVKPARPVALPEPPLPVQQVKQLGLTQCADVVDKMARTTLTSAYDVQSGWNREAPAEHVFQSVAVLNRPENKPPDGVTALVAAPMASGGCDGVAMQVFPLAGDCQSVQKVLLAKGGATTPILNARIMVDREGKRLFLLPGFAHTCIAIAVDSTFGAAPAGAPGRP